MWLFSAKLWRFLLPNQVFLLLKPTKQWAYDKMMSWCFKNTDIRHYKCRREIFVFLILRWTSRLKCESSSYLTDDVAQWPDHLRSDTQHFSLLSTELNWKRSAAARSNTQTHKKLQSFPARFSLFSDGLVSPWLLHTHSSVTHFIKNTWNHSFPSPRSHPFIFSSLTADRLMNQRQDGSTTHDWQEVSASDGDGESHLKSLSATRLLNERRRGS